MQIFPFSPDSFEIIEIMKSIGVSGRGMEIMKDRFSFSTFMIRDISSPAANVIKQHCLSLGGEAAVPKHAVNCGEQKSDLIFSLRNDKLPVLIEKFKQQCWKLPEIALVIEQLMTCNSIWHNFSYKTLPKKSAAVMGILNVTPDSFSDGGNFINMENALNHALSMIGHGADIIDIGGESTRPGADEVSVQAEIERTVPVIKSLKKLKPEVLISIDTTKHQVAYEAIKAGADMINDISGLSFDESLAGVAAETGAPLILMHIQGKPRTMQNNPLYHNLIGEILVFLENSVQKALSKGVKKEQLIADPGFGFGKTAEHNLYILRHLESFKSLGLPLLIGTSRKSFIGKVTGKKEPSEREAGTTATHTMALMKGAALLRTHNVKDAKDCVLMHNAVMEAQCC